MDDKCWIICGGCCGCQPDYLFKCQYSLKLTTWVLPSYIYIYIYVSFSLYYLFDPYHFRSLLPNLLSSWRTWFILVSISPVDFLLLFWGVLARTLSASPPMPPCTSSTAENIFLIKKLP